MRWALWAAAAALAVLLAGWLAGLQPARPQSLASRGLRPGLATTHLQPVSVAPKGPDGAGSAWTHGQLPHAVAPLSDNPTSVRFCSDPVASDARQDVAAVPAAVLPAAALLATASLHRRRPQSGYLCVDAAPPRAVAIMAFTGQKPLLLSGAVGVAVSGYILLWKSALVPTFCGSSSCADVLSGPFSTVFGVPIAVPALAAYSILLLLSLSPPRPTDADAPADDLEAWQASAVVTLSTTMAAFSAYLMSLLTFRLGAFCPLCLTSAAASLGACATAWTQGWAEAVPQPRRRTCLRLALGAALIGSALHFYSGISQATPQPVLQEGPYAPPAITATSSDRALALAARLEALGAQMYGAYWCSHCYDQKQTLGREAFERLPYVECDSNGVNSQRQTCKARGVKGYPTWEVRDALLPGEKSLDELEAIVAAAEAGGDIEAAADEAYEAYLRRPRP
eukprot:EG_transcript_10452